LYHNKQSIQEVNMNPTATADALYVNGNIYTVDGAFSKASVIATRGDTILYVGDAFKGRAKKEINLQGKTVIPGLIEGHMHLMMEGLQFIHLNLFGHTKGQVLEAVKERAETLEPGQWIKGSGWNQMDWPGQNWPTKEELDAAAPRHPVMLERIDLHSLWVNSTALAAAGITGETADPQGGEIIRNERGEPSGILVDTARNPVFNAAPAITTETKERAFLLAQEECFSYGLTGAFDAGISFEDVCLLKELYACGKMKLRVYAALTAADGSDTRYIEAGCGPVKGLYGNRLSVNAVKAFADGSIGSRSALLFEDYHDRPGHRGKGVYTDGELYETVYRAGKRGFQVALHAIGDAAIRQVIEVYERVQKELGLVDPRYRIEHFCVPARGDTERAVKNGHVLTLQAAGAVSHTHMLQTRLGEKRFKAAYPWRKIIKAGGYVVGGSDANTDYLNPFYGLHAGVVGHEEPEKNMTREESLKSYTLWAAKGQFEEGLKGSLEAGKLADFAVLDRDIITCETAEIREARVLMTVLGGEVVYERATNTFCPALGRTPLRPGVPR
jgi:hypothetical protein